MLCLVLINESCCYLVKFNFTFTFNSFLFNLVKEESAENNSILTRAINCLKYGFDSGLGNFIFKSSVPVQLRFGFKKNNYRSCYTIFDKYLFQSI